MKRPGFVRRMGPVGLFLTAYDIYRRLPPQQRRWLVAETRRVAPIVVVAVARRARRRPKP